MVCNVPVDARRSCNVIRQARFVTANGSNVPHVSGDPAPTEGVDSGDGRTTSVNSTEHVLYGDTILPGSATVAEINGRRVQAEVLSHQRCKMLPTSTNRELFCREQLFSRAERRFVTTEPNCHITGECSIDSKDFLGGAMPAAGTYLAKIRADASVGSAKSFIEGLWNPGISCWMVTWQYVYSLGTSSIIRNGSYLLPGIDQLDSDKDKVPFDFFLPYAGDDLFGSAFSNKSHWIDNWWSTYASQETIRVSPGTTESHLWLTAKTIIDGDESTQSYPADPRDG